MTDYEYGFPYLVDAPEDGGFEEHAHIPMGELTKDEVVKEFVRIWESEVGEHPLLHHDHTVTLTVEHGIVLLIPKLELYDDDGEEIRELVGLEAQTYAQEHQREEGLRYHVPATEDEIPLAQPWWRIDVEHACGIDLGLDPEEDPEEELYLRCNLRMGHEGECQSLPFLRHK